MEQISTSHVSEVVRHSALFLLCDYRRVQTDKQEQLIHHNVQSDIIPEIIPSTTTSAVSSRPSTATLNQTETSIAPTLFKQLSLKPFKPPKTVEEYVEFIKQQANAEEIGNIITFITSTIESGKRTER